MTTAHQQPDLAACNDAARMTRSELVTALRELLGAELVAYLGRREKPAPSGSGPKAPAPSTTRPTSNACASPTAPPA